MAKPPKKERSEWIETEPEGWERFQRTMDKVVPPKRAKKQRVDKAGGQDKPDRPKRTSQSD